MKIIASFVLFALFTTAVQAQHENHTENVMNCYSCSSEQTTACLDPFNNTGHAIFQSQCGYLEDRANNEILHTHFPGVPQPKTEMSHNCLKTSYTDKNGKNVTIRMCSMLGDNVCETLSASKEADGGVVNHCSLCKSNLCNSAVTISTTIIPCIFALIIRYFYQ